MVCVASRFSMILSLMNGFLIRVSITLNIETNRFPLCYHILDAHIQRCFHGVYDEKLVQRQMSSLC